MNKTNGRLMHKQRISKAGGQDRNRIVNSQTAVKEHEIGPHRPLVPTRMFLTTGFGVHERMINSTDPAASRTWT
jgi:hypothetical protein